MKTEKRFLQRRRKWIRSDVQLRSVLILFLASAVVLTLYAQLCLLSAWSMMGSGRGADADVLNTFSEYILQHYLVTLLMAGCLSIFLGIYQTFRFSGPIYRIGEFLRGMPEGRWDGECRLRSTDMLHDVKDNVNAAVSGFTGFIEKQQVALRAARMCLEGAARDGANDEVIERIDGLEREFGRRLGPPVGEVEVSPDRVGCASPS